MSFFSTSDYPVADNESLQTWDFPTSEKYPTREYQVDICRTALFHNTLVCLPTGLGKTLIAAVVIYNFYKWFPTGKIVFLAPTKPLVNQQVEACFKITGVSETDTGQLEGTVKSEERERLWKNKRLLFCTPQTFNNDLEKDICDPLSIVCVVFDEAHKASTDAYAYAQVIQKLSKASSKFRVLGLSATPGSDLKKIQSVIRNLKISRLEIRTDDDPEIQKHTHPTMIDYVECSIDANSGVKDIVNSLNILMKNPTMKLFSLNLIQSKDPEVLSIHHLSKDFIESLTKEVEKSAALECIKLLERLLDCRKAVNTLDGCVRYDCVVETLEDIQLTMKHECEKYTGNHKFRQLISTLQKCQNDQQFLSKRNPKLGKLKEILYEHFHRHRNSGSSTRVIVFVDKRATVSEIVAELDSLYNEGIMAREFVGQSSASVKGKGLNQAEQKRVLSDFNAGIYTNLHIYIHIYTCIHIYTQEFVIHLSLRASLKKVSISMKST